MKRISTIFAGLFFLLLSFSTKAQTAVKNDYFVSKWNVKIEGTPEGDATLLFDLTRKDNGINGTISDSTGKTELSKIEKIEEPDEKTIVLYFHIQGYDVNLRLEKKDADKVEGSLMGMFNAKGERLKAETKTN